MSLTDEVVERVALADALQAFGLEAPRRGKMRCPIPGHDDNSPSASVGRKDGRDVWYCHVCGVGGDVVGLVKEIFSVDGIKAIQVLARTFGIIDPYDEPVARKYRAHKPPAEPTAKTRTHHAEEDLVKVEGYTYRDEEGTPLFQVLRYEPKTFRQRPVDAEGRPLDGPGKWKMDGVRRVLYRLPEVLWGIENGRTIYVVEGERDVHAAMHAGLVATCNPGGAGKWLSGYSESLRGADVVVVADRDPAGLAHGRAVVKALWGHVESIKLVAPLEGKDLRDHFAAGHSIEDLSPLSISGERISKKKRSRSFV